MKTTFKLFGALAILLFADIAHGDPLVNRGFGDSMMAGGNNGSSTTSSAMALWPYVVTPWLSIVAAKRGEISDNRGLSGYTLADQAASLFTYQPTANVRHFIQAGRADQTVWGSGTAALSQTQKSLSAFVYWLAGTKYLATTTAWTFAGTWSATPFYGLGKYTQQNGATASFTISGDVLAFQQVVCDSNTTSITVKSDGVTVGTFNSIGDHTIFRGGSTPIYMPALRRIAGLGAGSHSIQIIANVTASPTGTDLVMLDWFWAGSNGYPLYVVTNSRALTLISDADTTAGNATISAVAAQAASDGMNVTVVNAGQDIDPLKNLTDDLLHLSNTGHHNMAGAVEYRGGL